MSAPRLSGVTSLISTPRRRMFVTAGVTANSYISVTNLTTERNDDYNRKSGSFRKTLRIGHFLVFRFNGAKRAKSSTAPAYEKTNYPDPFCFPSACFFCFGERPGNGRCFAGQGLRQRLFAGFHPGTPVNGYLPRWRRRR